DKDKIAQEREKSKGEFQSPLTDYQELQQPVGISLSCGVEFEDVGDDIWDDVFVDGGGGDISSPYTGVISSRRRGRSKEEIARRRIERLPSCGSTGGLAVYRRRPVDDYVLRYHPHTCGSVFCPYCAWKDSQRLFSRLERLLEVLPRVAFLTLTLPSSFSPFEAVEYAYRVKQRFYQKRVFGKKVYPRLRQRALELMEVYLSRISNERMREKLRELHMSFLERFEEEWKDYLYDSKCGLKFGQIFNSVWKFELTYSPEHGFHPHWHVLVAGYYPLFLLQALWIECGGGEVIDIRAVNNRRGATAELTKYILKPAVSGVLTEEEMVQVEIALYNRKKLEVWGLAELELVRDEEEEEYEFVAYLYHAEVGLSVPNLRDVPRLVRELRRREMESGERCMFYFCDATVYNRRTGREQRFPVLLDSRGRFWLFAEDIERVEVWFDYQFGSMQRR
ncbi:MAG: hypothetical protein QW733_07415, partial [Desulfurococcaceae archaeon]